MREKITRNYEIYHEKIERLESAIKVEQRQNPYETSLQTLQETNQFIWNFITAIKNKINQKYSNLRLKYIWYTHILIKIKYKINTYNIVYSPKKLKQLQLRYKNLERYTNSFDIWIQKKFKICLESFKLLDKHIKTIENLFIKYLSTKIIKFNNKL